MPTVRKKKNPKISTTENAPISTAWEKAIENRKPHYCAERKATIYKK